MGEFLAVIGFLGFIIFIVLAVISAIKKTKKGKKMLGFSALCFVVMMIGGSLLPPSETQSTVAQTENKKENVEKKKDSADEPTNKTEKSEANTSEKVEETPKQEPVKEKETESDVGSEAVVALQSNDFIRFTEEYKKLGKNKTPVWDNQLYGTKVTWTGNVVRAGTSQLFLYGDTDYKGESWDVLGDNNKLYYSFVAKYADGTAEEFKQLQTGDIVTVEGDLESRGDFELNFHWKIYNAKLINKQ
jgi:hypothetical protein